MTTINWNEIITNLRTETISRFVDGGISLKTLYALAVEAGIGPEVRPLVREYGAEKARKNAASALRRRRVSV